MTSGPRSRRSGPRSGVVRPVDLDRRLTALVAATAAGLVAACGASSSGPEATPDGYRAELSAICIDTAAALDALPTPPEQITVTEFAVDAASVLASEAERARELAVPDELADDHRAFIRNTDDQAAAWRAVADSGGNGSGSSVAESDLVALTTRIGELQLGRDDLAVEMGVDACRRTDG